MDNVNKMKTGKYYYLKSRGEVSIRSPKENTFANGLDISRKKLDGYYYLDNITKYDSFPKYPHLGAIHYIFIETIKGHNGQLIKAPDATFKNEKKFGILKETLSDLLSPEDPIVIPNNNTNPKNPSTVGGKRKTRRTRKTKKTRKTRR
jgi:hypothetical protein